MKEFPPLDIWFRFIEDDEIKEGVKIVDGYYEHNECLFFTLLWKKLADKKSFVNEFVKLIARTRKPNGKFILGKNNIFEDFISFIDGGISTIDKIDKEKFIKAVFTKGLYGSKGLIENGFKGYFGEVFYYLIREQFKIDNLTSICPSLPKDNPSEAGLDFTEIRKDAKGYYFIIGEVKTTDHNLKSKGFNNLPEKIIKQISERPEETFNEHLNFFEESLYGKDDDLDDFLDNINNYTYNFSDTFKTDRKRFYGVINYNSYTKQHNSLFKSFKNKTNKILHNGNLARNVKLIGVLDFEEIRDMAGNLIFNEYLN